MQASWHGKAVHITGLIARFMGPAWGPSGADRTQVGPMLAPWTLLFGPFVKWSHQLKMASTHEGLVIWRIDIFFVAGLSNLLNKQSSCWQFETAWRLYDVNAMKSAVTCNSPGYFHDKKSVTICWDMAILFFVMRFCKWSVIYGRLREPSYQRQ